MNIFVLTNRQLQREGLLNKSKYIENLIDRAIRIRKYLDYKERGKAISKGKRGVK